MRAVWGGFCALALFGLVQTTGLWTEKPSNKAVSRLSNPESKVSPTQTAPIVKRDTSPSEASITLSSSAIALLIIQQSRSAYYATGYPCACPDDLMRNGRRCGERSAHSRPGGAAPKCYPNDVTAEDIKHFLVQQ
jgi:hypothetical protein